MVSVEFVVRLYDQLCQRITVSGLRIFRAFRHVPYGNCRYRSTHDHPNKGEIRLIRTVVTKQARLIEMLRRLDGATITELAWSLAG
jgi:hypothetical protein